MGKRRKLDTSTGAETEKKKIEFLIRRYRNRQYKQNRYRSRLRNEIYGLMRTKILGYIKGVLSKWHRHEGETTILSLSWDAFLFCLDRYSDEKYDVYGHFNTYTRYFLLLHYGGSDKMDREVYLEDFKAIVEFGKPVGKAGDHVDALDKLLELRRFRDSLVQEHQRRIFDHIIMNDHPEMFANLKKDRGGTSCYSYYKSFGIKEAFKKIIDFILERDDSKKR